MRAADFEQHDNALDFEAEQEPEPVDDGMDIVDDGEGTGTGTGEGDGLAMQPHQQDFSRPPGIEYWNWGMVERLRRKLSALIADATTDEHQRRKLRHMRESIGVVETKLDPQPASGPVVLDVTGCGPQALGSAGERGLGACLAGKRGAAIRRRRPQGGCCCDPRDFRVLLRLC